MRRQSTIYKTTFFSLLGMFIIFGSCGPTSAFIISPSTRITTTTTTKLGQQSNKNCNNYNINDTSSCYNDNDIIIESNSRRLLLLRHVVPKTAVAAVAAAAAAAVFTPSIPANAVMENAQKVFKVGSKLTIQEAYTRFLEGRTSVQYLLDNYTEIYSNGGGDNVRRYLGTVGTSSGLYGISKVLKILAETAEDNNNIVEYTELATEIEKTIQQADGSAYMAIFVTTSSSSTPPEKYFADAKIEIKRCIKAMDEIKELMIIDQ